jgi:hypothetical protein
VLARAASSLGHIQEAGHPLIPPARRARKEAGWSGRQPRSGSLAERRAAWSARPNAKAGAYLPARTRSPGPIPISEHRSWLYAIVGRKEEGNGRSSQPTVWQPNTAARAKAAQRGAIESQPVGSAGALPSVYPRATGSWAARSRLTATSLLMLCPILAELTLYPLIRLLPDREC